MGILRLGACAAVLLACPAAAAQAPLSGRDSIRSLMAAGDYPAAERALQKEIERSPDWDAGYLMLAQIHAAAGRYELAWRSARAAVRLRESLDGFMLLAVSAMRLNRLNESIEWLEKAASRRPDYAEIYKVLGLDYALGGMMPEAGEAFRRAAGLAPGTWEYRYLLGRALFELGRSGESRDALLEAARLNPSSSRVWTALGQAQERLGDAAPAEASYRRALACCQGGECAWPLMQLGLMYSVANGAAAGVPYYEKAVAARPGWARAHYHLGKALAATEDLRAAKRELEEAVRLDAGQPEYHYQLAGVYRVLSEPAKADAELARFRRLRKPINRGPEFVEP